MWVGVGWRVGWMGWRVGWGGGWGGIILPSQSLVAPTETLTCRVPCAINSNQPIANQASMLVLLKVSKRPIRAFKPT